MFKITVKQADLLKALSHAQSIVERRQTIPILSNVLLETQESGILLRATDNEIEISEKVAAQVSEVGAITMPAHKLYDIVRRLPDDGELTLAYAETTGQVTLSCGRSRFALASLPAENFPTMAKEEAPFTFTLATSDLSAMITKTGFAVSVEETRYNLNGIYLHTKEDNLVAVATDGHRLACTKRILPEGAKDMPGVIIPRKTINEITKLLGENANEVVISLSANQIRFGLSNVELSSRLIDGTYPDYEKVIPANNSRSMIGKTKTLSGVIERVSVVCEKSRGIKLNIKPDLLMVSATATDEGSAEDELDIQYTGDEIEIGFNFRYLLDILSQIKGEESEMRFEDGVSPVILQDVKDTDTLYVLMPMRV
ncbi:MAG: DNA polymerase III subunit beta [Alphaproteobacteria bacterium]|nr:DNA polymerase III subunit beta [Alphaproteobacteria bacterium]